MATKCSSVAAATADRGGSHKRSKKLNRVLLLEPASEYAVAVAIVVAHTVVWRRGVTQLLCRAAAKAAQQQQQ
jgi:hypothetical protein